MADERTGHPFNSIRSPRRASRRLSILFSFLAISFLLVSPIVLTSDETDGSASAASLQDYGYVLTYNANNSNITKVEVYNANGTVKKVVYNGTNTGTISSFWAFDPDTSSTATGLGPFNSFYAALNITNTGWYDRTHTNVKKESDAAGDMAFVLNPYNLNQNKYGQAITAGDYNIVLVIPTVYWYSDTDANKLYISNRADFFTPVGISSEKMKAYAHTVSFDGKTETVVPYLALGVYESSIQNSKLVSKASVSPASSFNYSSSLNSINSALETRGQYMVWDFHQWTLYKIMTYTVMGNKAFTSAKIYSISDKSFINGGTMPTGKRSTGGTASVSQDSYGYCITNSGKGYSTRVFLENAIGSEYDYVGQAYYSSGKLVVGNSAKNGTSHNVPLSTSVSYPYSGGGFHSVSVTSEASDSWDAPTSVSGGASRNPSIASNNNNKTYIIAAGHAGHSRYPAANAGAWDRTSYTTEHVAHRLAYAFPGYGVTYDANAAEGGAGTVSDNTLYAIGSTVSLKSDDTLTNSNPDMRFIGWKCSEDDRIYSALGTYPFMNKPAGIAVKFTAQWSQDYVTVNYDGNGGEGAQMETQYIPVGASVTLRKNTYSHPDKGFVAWVNDDDIDDRYSDGQRFTATVPGGSLNLVAVWGDFLTMDFDVAGGSKEAPVPDTVYEGGEVILPGYSGTLGDLYFDGWLCSADGLIYMPRDQYTVPGVNVTFTARYAPGFTVHYDNAGGEAEIADENFAEGMTVIVSYVEPYREDHLFKGWQSSHTGDVMAGGTAFPMPRENVTMLALWEYVEPEEEDTSVQEEDDDDIIEILRLRQAAYGGPGDASGRIDWMTVCIGAIAVAAASCLVAAFVIRKRIPEPGSAERIALHVGLMRIRRARYL